MSIFLTRDDPRNQIKTLRASIIPFIVKDDKLWLCLGRDTRSGELCDCGGGIKFSEHTVNGAFRNFNEETNNLFTREITLRKLFNESVTMKNSKMTVFFIQVGQYMVDATRNFQRNDDVSELVWMEGHTFMDLINFKCEEDTMWIRTARFFQKVLRNTVLENLKYHMNVVFMNPKVSPFSAKLRVFPCSMASVKLR
jgi:hypothetical protein